MDTLVNIPELVDEICLHCDKPELAALGRTARLFDCALDVLWSDLTTDLGALHLFQCLSSQVVSLSFNKLGSYPYLALQNPIEARHWERFKFYAKRVRSLHLRMSLLHRRLLEAILLWAPLGALLPNLRSLRFGGIIREPMFLRLFPGPSLEFLDLKIGKTLKPDLQAEMVAAISLLPTLCPGLDTFAFSFFSDDQISAKRLLEHLVNLRVLLLKGIFPIHFIIIPSLSNLTKLSLCFGEDKLPPIPSDLPVLVSLRTFHIQGTTAQILRGFDFIGECSLEHLSLQSTSESAADVSTIVGVVTSQCVRSTLQSLVLRTPRLVRALVTLAENAEISCNCLSPFFTFPSINSFECPLLPWLRPDDRFIADLAQSWPKLVSLDVSSSNVDPLIQQHPRLTVASFVSLVSYCPKLAHLSIEFDATFVNNLSTDLPTRSGVQVTNSLLRTLDVGRSPIDATQPLTAFLLKIFPQLHSISFSHSISGLNDFAVREKWGQVVEELERSAG